MYLSRNPRVWLSPSTRCIIIAIILCIIINTTTTAATATATAVAAADDTTITTPILESRDAEQNDKPKGKKKKGKKKHHKEISRNLCSLKLKVPQQAQLMCPENLAALEDVLPPDVYNGTSIYVPPGLTRLDLSDKPFHVYDRDFLTVIGRNPSLNLIAQSDKDPLFHEAVVYDNKTGFAYFVQNAGAKDAGTGLEKSAIIQRINVKAAQYAAKLNNGTFVEVTTIDNTTIPIINPNGATTYKGHILFTGEGMGSRVPPALYKVKTIPPRRDFLSYSGNYTYNATVLINNFYGRQFNSLNDVAVNPSNLQIYFTDVPYGYWQNFRPQPVLPNQIYKFDPETSAVQVVAGSGDFQACNGITFSPKGTFAYVTDTGANMGFKGYNYAGPATIYRFTVTNDGSFVNRKFFAYVSNGVPDGIHCDYQGNVFAACGDGIHVWNVQGKFLGKIFTGGTSANFAFVGRDGLLIAAETRLYYATLDARGSPPQ